MTDKKPVPPLVVETLVAASPDAVWAALTDPLQVQNWFPLKSGGSGLPGGKLLLSWGADCEWETHVTKAEPGRMVQWMDVDPAEAEPGALLPICEWTLEAEGGKTRVRLVQSGFDPDSNWEDYYDGTRRGWTYFLQMLGHYLEYHAGRTREMIFHRGRTVGGRAAVWQSLLAALGVEAAPMIGEHVALNLLPDAAVSAQVRFVEAPHAFSARIEGLNEASLFIEFEPGGDDTTCGVWLSTFDLPEAQQAQLATQLKTLCQGLLE